MGKFLSGCVSFYCQVRLPFVSRFLQPPMALLLLVGVASRKYRIDFYNPIFFIYPEKQSLSTAKDFLSPVKTSMSTITPYHDHKYSIAAS